MNGWNAFTILLLLGLVWLIVQATRESKKVEGFKEPKLKWYQKIK